MPLFRRLPDDLVEFTLEKLQPSQTAWTVPWAMWVDHDRQCWLHPKYTAHGRPGGTVQMRVERFPDGTFLVDVRNCPGHRWEPSSTQGYVGGEAIAEWLEVSSLVTS